VPDDSVCGPGFISIIVSDHERSAAFYQEFLGARRDPYDFGPHSTAFLGWPAFAVSSDPARGRPSPETTTISLWFRSADAQATYERAKAAGVAIVREPFDGPFGRQFVLADPDGYRVTVYEKDQPLYWPPKA
jgi:predicted enzyme related to lactoylglutathione lyase